MPPGTESIQVPAPATLYVKAKLICFTTVQVVCMTGLLSLSIAATYNLLSGGRASAVVLLHMKESSAYMVDTTVFCGKSASNSNQA